MTLEIVHRTGADELAEVFVARLPDGSCIEFVESVQPPVPQSEKWVLIVSTLKGCPVSCPICDAGNGFHGRLSKEEILAQIAYLIEHRYPDSSVPVSKFKIQFARMGDPAFNDAVLDVLEELPRRFDAPGLMPCVSTIAPAGRRTWFERLIGIKDRLYGGGRFQMQFSLHATDEGTRRTMIPAQTWSFEEIAAFGERFHRPGDRKVALNFAPAAGYPFEPERLEPLFSPELFMIKLTPINPTGAARRSGLTGLIDPFAPDTADVLVERFRACGYDTLLSIGELRENEIGSNCGMYIAEAVGSSSPAYGRLRNTRYT